MVVVELAWVVSLATLLDSGGTVLELELGAAVVVVVVVVDVVVVELGIALSGLLISSSVLGSGASCKKTLTATLLASEALDWTPGATVVLETAFAGVVEGEAVVVLVGSILELPGFEVVVGPTGVVVELIGSGSADLLTGSTIVGTSSLAAMW